VSAVSIEPVASPADFPVLVAMPTRWNDNDAYGHVNNAVFYEYFDTVVNSWLDRRAGAEARLGEAIGVVAESGCRYLREVSYPQELLVGLACERLGRSSVTYRLAVFGPAPEEGAKPLPSAVGRFVHVYVDRTTRRPMPVPEAIREAVGSELLPRPTGEDEA
jgi:acyl-CoA thioester hydrolase